MSNNFYTAFGTYVSQHTNCVEGFEDTTTNTFASTLTEAPVETTTAAPVETTNMNKESVDKLSILLTDIGENMTTQINKLSKIVKKLNEIKN